MKLNLSIVFDFALVAATKAGKELESFIDHYNSSIDVITSALFNRLTFEDNFQGQQIVTKLKHNTAAKIKVKRLPYLGILVLKVDSTTDALTNFVASANQDGQIVITPQFKLASTTEINVTLFILFPTGV